MPTPQPFYINGPDLASATTVYFDAALTMPAYNGFYSDGVVTRQQVSYVLLPQQPCPNCCGPACRSWNIKSISGSFTIKYIRCGGGVTTATYPDPTDTNICVDINDTPNVTEGSCDLTIAQECGCCTTACETWLIDNVITPTAIVEYEDCFGGTFLQTVSNGLTATLCIESGTIPVVVDGTARVSFQSCDCI